MSATHNSPNIGLNLRGFPLSAVTVSKHYLPRRLHWLVRQNAYHLTWSASSKSCFHVIVTQQKPIVEQFATKFRNLPLQTRSGHEWIASTSLHVIKTVNLTLVQCECHIGKQTVIARINPNNQNSIPDLTICRNFCFLVPISRGGANARFIPLCWRPCCHGSQVDVSSLAIIGYHLLWL